MLTSSRRRFLFLSTSGLVAGGAAHAQNSTPAALLEPYYRDLEDEITLPRAPEGPQLAPETEITRFAVGSCNNQEGDQSFWQGIASRNPQLFLYIGDNVYGDPGWDGGADLGSLRRAYERLNGHPEFQEFRKTVPMHTVWDDHDYGFNDGGAVFPFKRWSEHIYETFWNSPEDVRGREGVYHARTYGPQGRRVQIILLDTRFQRSPLVPPAPGQTLPVNGRYVPDTSADAQMLGEAQWTWLAEELAKPADLRVVVSSIQVLSDAHLWEGWELMPRERERLYAALAARKGGGLVLLSGDRHVGGIYRKDVPGAAQGLWEMTASSLNRPNASNAEATAREPDADRQGMCVGDANFGEVVVDWTARKVTLTVCRTDGQPLVTRSFGFAA
ncbi:alkaline phosphatase D family protein [Novosphingobium mangrovi (ex Hu et al. 2023)]|uniref:Alkaline phosphatase family protein n=1 Tax=Novosphingobium mangrovi (ex Hu et al. 2023) TaxID=2930094 RepID=A0ABT0AA43_9SPHN|nr:alkaline phosphatase D family protein [Novosphingobium mangrovi (ex Hu et al. 2023)]MCJ1960070.1 alkaline phosphatase family protein [Novosphingobium mangrovi (ex Hu et al. 2023)]